MVCQRQQLNKFLDPRERGNTLTYLKVCLLLTEPSEGCMRQVSVTAI